MVESLTLFFENLGITKVPEQLEYLSNYGNLLFEIWETLYAPLAATFFAYVIGLPLGVLLVTGEKEGIRPLPPALMRVLNTVINLLRSVPFLILMVLVNVFVSFFIEPTFVAIFGGTMKEVLGEIHNVLPTLVRTGISLVLLPLVMGIGYELLKLAGRYDNFLTRLISLPGVWLQHITVLEPDDSMIECAIAAIKEVIPEDESDQW